MNKKILKTINFIYKINYYFFLKRKIEKYNVKSIEDTINKIKTNKKSISRFGDGEFSYIFKKNKNIKFEKNSESLSLALKKVLTVENNNVLIGLPDQFRGLGTFSKSLDEFYIYIFNKFSRFNSNILKLLSYKRVYYNTEFTRIYADYLDKTKSKKLFAEIKSIWKNRNVLIVEGKYTRFGIGNDLLDDASDVVRIECPSENAFEKYNYIHTTVKKYLDDNADKNFITLIALGPTATVLAYDLGTNGYQSIDIGHLDLEYEWFLKKAKGRINLPDRYVNEVDGGANNIVSVDDEKYIKQIKEKIV